MGSSKKFKVDGIGKSSGLKMDEYLRDGTIAAFVERYGMSFGDDAEEGVTRIPAPRAMEQIVMAASTEMDLTVVESMEVVADMVGGMKGCDYFSEPGLYHLLLFARVKEPLKEFFRAASRSSE